MVCSKVSVRCGLSLCTLQTALVKLTLASAARHYASDTRRPNPESLARTLALRVYFVAKVLSVL